MRDLPRVIAVDFDNCLCESDYPFIIGPKKEVIDYVKSEKAKGSAIVLWTCRHGKQLRYALQWCEQQGLRFNAVNNNIPEVIKKYGDKSRKIYADVYIDDRSMNVGDLMNGKDSGN